MTSYLRVDTNVVLGKNTLTSVTNPNKFIFNSIFGNNALQNIASGFNNVAFGYSANAAAISISDTTCIGSNSIANANGSTSIGFRAQSTATSAISIGSANNNVAGPLASSIGSISIGSAGTSGIGPVASTGIGTIAIGSGMATNTGFAAVGAAASGTKSIAIGTAGSTTFATGTGAAGALADGSQSIAIGAGGTATTVNAGVGARASGASSLAIGSGGTSGAGASATGIGAVAIGNGKDGVSGAQATAYGAISMGLSSTASGGGSIALGCLVGNVAGPTANSSCAIAIGSSAGSGPTNFSARALGLGAIAIGGNSNGLGGGAHASGAISIAIGAGGASAVYGAIAIGSGNGNSAGAAASGFSAIVIGSSSGNALSPIGSGRSCIVIGSCGNNNAAGAFSNVGYAVAIGSGGAGGGAGARITGYNSIAIGAGSSFNTFAGATVTATRGIAFGVNSSVASNYGIAIGSCGTSGVASRVPTSSVSAIAIGSGNSSRAGASAAIGYAISIGSAGPNGIGATTLTGTGAIAIGSGGAARDAGTAAVGAAASAFNAIAIGAAGNATTAGTAAGAAGAISNAVGAISIGGGGLVISGTTAPGAGAAASATNAIAIGTANLTFAGAVASAVNSIAIGGASTSFAGAIASTTESVAIGLGAITTNANDVSIGRPTNGTTGVFKYRSQIVSQESWSDSTVAPAYINATGNFVKGGTPVLGLETIANTNENAASTPALSTQLTFVTTSPATTLTNTAAATGASGTFLGFSTSIATDSIYTAVYGNPGVNNIPTYPPTGGTNGSIAFRAGPGTTFSSFTITNPTIASTDLYGYAVAISADGKTLAVGAPGVSTSAGAIYIWQRATAQTAGWGSSVRTFSGAANDRLGYSVALSADGSTLVSGAPGASTAAAGKVYVYARNADGLWASSPTTEVNGTALGTTTTMLGYQVGISGDGDTIVIGSFVTGAAPGTAFYSTRSSGTWASATALTPTSPTNADGHGRGVAISQDANTIAVGATLTAVTNKVTIWQRSGSTYPTVGQSLAGSASTLFGTSIALSSDGLRLLVGAPGTSSNVGAAADYSRSTTTTAFAAVRTAITGDGTASGNFGWDVAMSADAAYTIIGTSLSAGRVFAENLNANGILAAGTSNGQTKKICASTFTTLNGNVARYDLFTITSAALTSLCIDSSNKDVYALRFDNRGASVDLLYDTASSKWIIQGGAGITTVT